MKKDINKRTLWVGFLKTPTELEINEAAQTMKNGKAYLFQNEDGELTMRWQKGKKENHQERKETFLRKIL